MTISWCGLLGSNPQPTARSFDSLCSLRAPSFGSLCSLRTPLARRRGFAAQAAGAAAIKAAAEWPTASASGISQPHRLWLPHRRDGRPATLTSALSIASGADPPLTEIERRPRKNRNEKLEVGHEMRAPFLQSYFQHSLRMGGGGLGSSGSRPRLGRRHAPMRSRGLQLGLGAPFDSRYSTPNARADSTQIENRSRSATFESG